MLYQLTQTDSIYYINGMYMACSTKVTFIYSGTLYTMVRNNNGIDLYVNTDNSMLLIGTVSKEGNCYIVRIFNIDLHTDYTCYKGNVLYAIHKYLQKQ